MSFVIFMSRDFIALRKLVEIFLFLIAGIIFLSLGVWFLTNPAPIAIFIIVVLLVTNNILIDNVFLANIIFTCGISFVVIGIISLFIGALITVKTIKNKEINVKTIKNKELHVENVEKKDYMNLAWLREQYYELGRNVQDIATDQGVTRGTIEKWLYKLDVESAGLGTED